MHDRLTGQSSDNRKGSRMENEGSMAENGWCCIPCLLESHAWHEFGAEVVRDVSNLTDGSSRPMLWKERKMAMEERDQCGLGEQECRRRRRTLAATRHNLKHPRLLADVKTPRVVIQGHHKPWALPAELLNKLSSTPLLPGTQPLPVVGVVRRAAVAEEANWGALIMYRGLKGPDSNNGTAG